MEQLCLLVKAPRRHLCHLPGKRSRVFSGALLRTVFPQLRGDFCRIKTALNSCAPNEGRVSDLSSGGEVLAPRHPQISVPDL